MNYPEIIKSVKFLKKTCKCTSCNKKYKSENINFIAATQLEGLFELVCSKCQLGTIVTVVVNSPEIEISELNNMGTKVSPNDILDTKNFLTNFDGNFKKLFKTQE